MEARSLLEALAKKLKTTSQASLASALGISGMTLHSWKTNNPSLTAGQLAGAIAKSKIAAVKDSQLRTIQPIVEFYGLRAALEQANGVYIFYDSRGRALYAGKAKDQPLWKEMNLAFNRDRELQKISLTHHPDRNQEFLPGHEKLRQPKRTQLALHQLAYYFSAYKIEYGMIDDLEALLVRGFANDLLNAKMETFAHQRAGT